MTSLASTLGKAPSLTALYRAKSKYTALTAGDPHAGMALRAHTRLGYSTVDLSVHGGLKVSQILIPFKNESSVCMLQLLRMVRVHRFSCY